MSTIIRGEKNQMCGGAPKGEFDLLGRAVDQIITGHILLAPISRYGRYLTWGVEKKGMMSDLVRMKIK